MWCYGKTVVLSLALIMLFLISCSPKTPPSLQTSQYGSQTKEETKPVATENWEMEWKKTLEAARKEGSVVIYASVLGPAVKDALPIFKQKYGINLEIISGRGQELRGKLLQERKNGLYFTDVMASGLNTIFGAVKASGALDPMAPALLLPEVLDQKLWYGGKLPWADKENLVFNLFYYPSTMININTDMVKPGEIKSLYDLLDPQWKNKIIISDPSVTGAAFNGFSSLIYNKVVDQDFFRQLVSQQNQMLRDQHLQADWLAKGKYPIALWADPEPLARYKEAGASIGSVQPREGTYLSVGGGGLVLIKQAPHPNATKVFINWLLSKEGSTFVQDKMQSHSARVDVSTNRIDPHRVREPQGKYFIGANSIEEWVLNEQDKYLETAKQIFAPITEKR